jgi:tellurium resistance protein TerD
MATIQKGFRCKLEDYVNPANEIKVEIAVSGQSTYDYSCFGVDGANKLSDDRYMIFYNQTNSPANEITLSQNTTGAVYRVNLSRLPSSINKLVFAVSIDGNGTMNSITRCSMNIGQSGNNKLQFDLIGKDFKNEKEIIIIEIYRKDVWRLAAAGSGFNGGLADLLRNYGGQKMLTPKLESVPLKLSLKKGERVSLMKNNMVIIAENGWKVKGKDYDLKALVRYRNGNLVYIGAANLDESLQTPDGAVKHSGDARTAGEIEKIIISWHPNIASVALSSYSALENGTGSFREYGVFVRIKNGSQEIKITASDASSDSYSYTLCFGEIIFGNQPGTWEVLNLELYSEPDSENRIGYVGNKVTMDIGPIGQPKYTTQHQSIGVLKYLFDFAKYFLPD